MLQWRLRLAWSLLIVGLVGSAWGAAAAVLGLPVHLHLSMSMLVFLAAVGGVMALHELQRRTLRRIDARLDWLRQTLEEVRLHWYLVEHCTDAEVARLWALRESVQRREPPERRD